MKRIGNIRDRMINLENGVEAVIRGTANKRKKREVRGLLYGPEETERYPQLQHQIDPERAREYIKPILKQLEDGTYRHHKPKHRRQFCPSSSGGKWRDLYIPSLRDHIVHHMLLQACGKAFTRGMHPHCCGSVPGRGTSLNISSLMRPRSSKT